MRRSTRILPYFGAKGKLGVRIAAELGPHRAYFEPCAGSMAVLGHKTPSAMETVNDLNGDLINLARVIRDPVLGPRFYRRCRRTLFCQDLYEESKARFLARWQEHHGDGFDAEHPDIDHAYDFYITSWMGRNGVAGTKSYNQAFAMRYTHGGGCSAKRWRLAADSINWWRKRLSGVTITRLDMFDLIRNIEDDPENAVYIDPPYVVKGAKYLHDFKGEEPHRVLARELARFERARVVVSYYDHPLIRELYDDQWTLVEAPMKRAMSQMSKRGTGQGTNAPEILLLNGRSFTDDAPLFSDTISP